MNPHQLEGFVVAGIFGECPASLRSAGARVGLESIKILKTTLEILEKFQEKVNGPMSCFPHRFSCFQFFI